jgi:hypothetical protein
MFSEKYGESKFEKKSGIKSQKGLNWTQIQISKEKDKNY